MLTRRTFLSGAAAATSTLAASLSVRPTDAAAAPLPPDQARATAPPTLALELVNRHRGRKMYAALCGVDPANGRWFFLTADGAKIFPSGGTSSGRAVPAAAAISIPASGSPRRIRVPRLASGRIFVSLDRPLHFSVTSGGGLVLPSPADPADRNAGTDWGFVELTFDANGVYANLSFVDFVGLPLSLRLATSGRTQYVGGLRPGGLAAIAAGLRAQSHKDGSAWRRLIFRHAGRELRILSPNLAAEVLGRNLFAGYLDSYVAAAWERYRGTALVVDTQSHWGRLTGRVGADGRLSFGRAGSFARPSTYAIFNCSVAPFHTGNDVLGNLSARLAAALNRTTLLGDAAQPDRSPKRFYTAPRTNHYARLVHHNSVGGAGYAFPYDDVHTGTWNAEGRVVHRHPKLLRIEAG